MLPYVMPMKDRKFAGFGTIQYGQVAPLSIFHFLVEKKEDSYLAINLEFALFSSADSEEGAIDELREHIVDYINTVMSKGRGVEELQEALNLHSMDEAWGVYRKLEFAFSMKGVAVNSKIASQQSEDVTKSDYLKCA